MPKRNRLTPPTPALTAAIATAHEQLLPRVVALLAQVERRAVKTPGQPVPAATLTVARSLFAEARKIVGREAARIAGSATTDLSALCLGLGQLKAALEAFEAGHSGWSGRLGCIAWRFDGYPEQPVSRLRPTRSRVGTAQAAGAGRPTDFGHMGKTRSEALTKLYRRMNEREAEAYDKGYADATAGRPRQPPDPVGDGWLPPSARH